MTTLLWPVSPPSASGGDVPVAVPVRSEAPAPEMPLLKAGDEISGHVIGPRGVGDGSGQDHGGLGVAFLGFARYYWCFIPAFARIAAPLQLLVGTTARGKKTQPVT
ncbi:hypothetical protein SKAU_G00278590 [Synaphobranchus kaupii]|uniref:Uncharacterized protein n=1 Tax=Synaphobranchus kaupii TaxID=118154 RepID=A0A9Q1EWK1_SYNKA|nr:hypothetical protein SKAU_G00278590 [Synaphobranchus kaupii]